MPQFKNIQFNYLNFSNIKIGVKGLVLLNNDCYYSFTLFDNFAVWEDIAYLEDQYNNEQIEELEKEIKKEYDKAYNTVSVNEKLILKLNKLSPPVSKPSLSGFFQRA